MHILQTANAGVLLTLDGTRILLDGICTKVLNFIETPNNIRADLIKNPPDALVFTHKHADHYDQGFALDFQHAGGIVIGPDSPQSTRVGTVSIMPFSTRHIGAYKMEHNSFVISGSRCIWFLGDASPNEIKHLTDLQKPDLLIVPFAYANSPLAWETTKGLNAKAVMIVHMPEKENDTAGIWQSVLETVKTETNVIISETGKEYRLF